MKDHHVSLRNSGIAGTCVYGVYPGWHICNCPDTVQRQQRYRYTGISVVLYNSHYPGIMSVYIQPMDIYNI